LDKQPELLFKLRGVDHETLVNTDIALPTGTGKRRRLDSDIGEVFGIDVDASDHRPGRQRDKKTETRNQPRPTKKAVKSLAAPRKASQSVRKKPLNPTSATVARLRQRLGLNGAQFAQLLGVSPTCITRWENTGGRLRLRESSKQALAMAADLEKSGAWKKLGLPLTS
ncbi:MAG: helix-turn-helix domain-containing protein, partial [Pseudomonadales bacterium]